MTRYMICDICGVKIDDPWKWGKLTMTRYGERDACNECQYKVNLITYPQPEEEKK